MKAVVVLLLVAVAFAQQIASSCQYNEASLPDEFAVWVNIRRSTCLAITNQADCTNQGYCWWRDTTNQNNLATHQQIFVPPRVYNPVPGVYVAVGYDLGNSILIVNAGQSVLIDTVGSVASGQAVKAAFEAALGTPIPTIVAVIYTHSHPDHFGGTAAFGIAPGTPIYTHATFLPNLQKFQSSQGALLPRSARQFGFYLGDVSSDGFLGCGIGPKVFFDNTVKVLPSTPIGNPNAVLQQLTATLAGLTFQLWFTPGETDDTITVWIPSLKVVAVGDNIYKSFPNLYAIRGTGPRDVKAWYTSVDKVRTFNAEVLIGSHSPPVGPDAAGIALTLTNYRDAIQYVHDQTLFYINQGLLPDDIAGRIALPPALASSPFLQEYYGFIPWCVKSIFTSYLGWFSGNIATLDLPSTSVQASRLVDLAGGPLVAIIKAVAALDEGTLEGAQWALQLADAINRTSARDEPFIPYVLDIYVQAAKILGYAQKSSNGRNYYLSVVEEIAANTDPVAAAFLSEQKRQFFIDSHMASPTIVFIAVVPTLVNAEKASEIEFPVKVNIKDVAEEYSIVVRKGIAEVYPTSEILTSQYEYSFEVTFATGNSFKSLILGTSSVEAEILNHNLDSTASVEALEFFFDLFH